MIRIVFSYGVVAFLSATAAAAQSTYLSYGDAILDLLQPSNDDFDTFNGPGLSPTSCPKLYADAFDFLTDDVIPVRDPNAIGPNLIRNCNTAQNIAYGSTRSLGFASDIPTSTFIPFDADRRRTESEESEDATEPPSTSGLTISSRNVLSGYQLIWANIGNVDVSPSVHEGAQSGALFGAGATFFSPDGQRGVSIRFGRSEISADNPPGVIPVFGPIGDPVTEAVFDAYAEACSTLQRSKSRSIDFGITGFRQEKLGAANLQLYAGGALSRSRYTNDLCYYTVQDIIGPVLASRISGVTTKFTFSTGGQLSRSFRVGGLNVSPSVSLEYSHTIQPSYREKDGSIQSVADSLQANSTVINAGFGETTPQLTGASLNYDTRHMDSLRASVGSDVQFSINRQTSVSLRAFYVKEFFDDPQIVTASFNEDLRDNPTRFSFQTNPLPSDYVDVGIGYHRRAQRAGGFDMDLRVSGTSGDDFVNEQALSISFRRQF